MKVQDLPKQPAANVMLRCLNCGDGEYSATRGDYFMLDPSHVMRCEECYTPLRLVRREVHYVRVKLAKGGK